MQIRSNVSVLFASALGALAIGATGCVVHEVDPSAGHIQHISGPNYEIHPRSNPALCLDVKGDKVAAGQEVQLYNCSGNPNQRWNFVDQPNNAMNIQGIGGFCLDVANGSMADGTPTNLYPCGPEKPNQSFRLFQDGEVREVHSNRCLTVASPAPGQQLTLSTCSQDNLNQVWTMSQ
jgi:hypothetical protein